MRSDKQTDKLLKGMLSGSTLALSRLISLIENSDESIRTVMEGIHNRTGRAYRLGITGPPGAGKSTIIDEIIKLLRAKDSTIGVLAVDPSSPFSGGAVLGDRIRMQKHTLDEGVFIRSVGSRGSHGGLSSSAGMVADLYDAFGFDYTIIETVGVGQTELDIMKLSDTTVVVLVPESGDSIQTLKAGLMEIADIFVINKSDRQGSDDVYHNLVNAIEMGWKRGMWKQPVLLTRALEGIGVEDLLVNIERHREFLKSSGELEKKRKRVRREELLRLLSSEFFISLDRLLQNKKYHKYVERVESGKQSPYFVARKILSNLKLD